MINLKSLVRTTDESIIIFTKISKSRLLIRDFKILVDRLL